VIYLHRYCVFLFTDAEKHCESMGRRQLRSSIEAHPPRFSDLRFSKWRNSHRCNQFRACRDVEQKTDTSSGCGDNVIRLWRNGQEVMAFKGHTNCVRALAAFPPLGFLSCGNDGFVLKCIIYQMSPLIPKMQRGSPLGFLGRKLTHIPSSRGVHLCCDTNRLGRKCPSSPITSC